MGDFEISLQRRLTVLLVAGTLAFITVRTGKRIAAIVTVAFNLLSIFFCGTWAVLIGIDIDDLTVKEDIAIAKSMLAVFAFDMFLCVVCAVISWIFLSHETQSRSYGSSGP